MPGETKTCNGCHTTANKTYPSHGRAGLTNPVNPGAPATGVAVPEYQPATLSLANAGATMAQNSGAEHLHANGSTPSGATTPCSQILSIDVIYDGIWTVGTTPPQPDAPFSYTIRRVATPDAADQCELRDVERAMPHHHPLSRSTGPGAQQLFYAVGMEPRQATHQHRQRRGDDRHTCSVCHNPVNAAWRWCRYPRVSWI